MAPDSMKNLGFQGPQQQQEQKGEGEREAGKK